MNDMLKWAIGLLAGSAAALIWGIQYRTDHPFAPLGALFGSADPTYSTAGWAIGLGTLGFLIGIAFLIAGLIKANQPPASAQTPQSSVKSTTDGHWPQ